MPVCIFLGCEQRADVGDLPPGSRNDAGTPDGSTTLPGTGMLETGDFPGALGGYQNGSTPGDAFGACFARTMLLFERPEVDMALAKLGQPPMSSSEVFGPNSIPVRFARSWSGTADLTFAAPINKTVHFDRAKAQSAGVSAEAFRDLASAWVSFTPSAEPVPTAGYHAAYTFDCATGQQRSVVGPYVSISYSDPDRYCSQPSMVPTTGCLPDGGSLDVLETGSTPGTRWKIRLTDLVLSCSCRGAACSMVGQPPVLTRVSGDLTGPAASAIDTTGLHPWLANWIDGEDGLENFLGATTAGTTLESTLRALYPLTTEISQAATECERAGQGSGIIFSLPGQLWAGDPLPVSAGDALIWAGLLRAMATMLWFSSGYEHSFVLAGFCSSSACADNATLVNQVNAAMPANRFPQGFSMAKAELDRALTSMIAGIDKLGADSVFPRNATTEAGLTIWRSWMSNAKSSLASGRAALDGFTPVVAIDLQALFTTPPTPASSSVDPLVLEGTSPKFVEAFYDETFKRYVDVILDGQTDYAGPREVEHLLQGCDDRLTRTGMMFNE